MYAVALRSYSLPARRPIIESSAYRYSRVMRSAGVIAAWVRAGACLSGNAVCARACPAIAMHIPTARRRLTCMGRSPKYEEGSDRKYPEVRRESLLVGCVASCRGSVRGGGAADRRDGRPTERARIPMPAVWPSRRGMTRYNKMITTHVSQLMRSLQESERIMNQPCVTGAVHGSQSPCTSASGRANTRFVRNPCAPGCETFQTHVTSPQP